eukprot:scaffold2103_cov185-Amphora_coffeaeformis.AAC.27
MDEKQKSVKHSRRHRMMQMPNDFPSRESIEFHIHWHPLHQDAVHLLISVDKDTIYTAEKYCALPHGSIIETGLVYSKQA